MSQTVEKTKNELHELLKGWLYDCANSEDEMEEIAEVSFCRAIRIVEREYVGGVSQFLIDAFPEMWYSLIMKIEFAEPVKFEVAMKPACPINKDTIKKVIESTKEKWAKRFTTEWLKSEEAEWYT